MLLSIIILNYKSKGLLKQCLKGILLLHLPFQYEIIVVDNASNDHCNKMIKEEFSQVKIILASFNRGYAAGNNLGMKIAQGKYVLILNPDIAVLKNSIEQLIKFMEQHSTAGMAGPKLINPNGSRQFSCFRFPRWYTPILRRTLLGRLPKAKKHLQRYIMSDYSFNQPSVVGWLLGACLLVRRQAISQVGLMDEHFFLYFEDVDWCRRFRQAGWHVYYLPSAEMVHFHQRLSAKNIFHRTTWIHIISWLKYLRKWRGKE